MVMRFLVAVVLLLAGNAFAAFPSSTQHWVYGAKPNNAPSAIASDKITACLNGINDQLARLNEIYGSQGPQYRTETSRVNNGTTCSVSTAMGTYGLSFQSAVMCPINSTGTTSCTCNAGFEENSSHTACVVVKTESEKFCDSMAGLTRKMSGETGGVIPASVCMLIDPPFPGETGKGCTMSTGDGIQVPKDGGGYYWSAIGKYAPAGTGACTPSVDPVLGDPRQGLEDDCPNGFAGMVNGVKTCVPAVPDKGITGTRTSSQTNPDGSQQTTKETTNCNGQQCTTTKEVTTTPAGGGTPTTVTSSTTTSLVDKCHVDPMNAVCTKGGGTAAGGGVGDDQGTECGIDGKPACKVKVDETGTPEGAGDRFDAAKGQQDDAKAKYDEIRDKASGSGDKGFFEPLRNFFWAPPVAACQPYTLPQQVGGLKLDACSVVDGIRAVMAFIWAAAALFASLQMVKRSFE